MPRLESRTRPKNEYAFVWGLGFGALLISIPAAAIGGSIAFSQAASDFDDEIAALGRTLETLEDFHARTGRYPAELATYERDALTVSALTDTTVDFYSGYSSESVFIVRLTDEGPVLARRR